MNGGNSNLKSMIITIIVMAVIGAFLVVSVPTSTISQPVSKPPEVWVNATWAGRAYGDVVDGHTFGVDATDTIVNGSGMVADFGTVHVAEGTYNENVVIDHPLVLSGANAGVPASGTRGNESVITGTGTSIAVNANDVIVDGFELDGFSQSINSTGDNNTIINNVIYAGFTLYPVYVAGNQVTFTGNNIYWLGGMIALAWYGDNGNISNNVISVPMAPAAQNVGIAETPDGGFVFCQGNNSVIAGNRIGGYEWFAPDGIQAIGDNVAINNNNVTIGTCNNYLIIVRGNKACISDNGLNANHIRYAGIDVTGDEAIVGNNMVSAQEAEGGIVLVNESGEYPLNGGAVTDNRVNIGNTKLPILVFADNAIVSGNTVHTVESMVGILVVGNRSTIQDNTYNATSSVVGLSLGFMMGEPVPMNGGTVTGNTVNIDESMAPLVVLANGALVNDNTVSTYDSMAGMGIVGNGTTVSGNTIGNESSVFSTGLLAVGSPITVTGNTVNFSSLDAGETSYSASAWKETGLLQAASADVQGMVGAMQLNLNGIAIYVSGLDFYGDGFVASNNAVVTGNTIGYSDSDYSTGIYVEGSSATISDNMLYADQIYDAAINVTGDGTTANNNVINNASEGIRIEGNYTTVGKNVITDFSGKFGICIEGTYSKITGNTMTGASDSSYGIYNEGQFATVDGNYMENVYDGIDVEGYKATVTYNTVNNSEFYNSEGDNIYVYGSDSKVIGNTLLNNENYWADDAIYLEEVSGATVSDNNITNAYTGIYIYGGDTTIGSNYIVENNTFTTYGNNYDSEDYYSGCIYGEYVNNVLIKGNTIKAVDGISPRGICLGDSSNVQVVDNYVENSDSGLYIDTCTGTSNLIDNNTLVLTYDGSAEYGMYLEYVGSATVSNNNITAEAGYWHKGIRARESGLLTVKDNIIRNSDDGIYIYSGCGPLYNTTVEGNTVANTMEQDSNNAIYVRYADRTTIKDNTVSSDNGTWEYGIGLYNGYSGLIDGNAVANATYGIIYDTKGYYGSDGITASAAGTQPASDWCTVQNNYVDLTGASGESVGISYFGQTGFIDYNTVAGSPYTSAGILGVFDNVSIIGNTVSGINQSFMGLLVADAPAITSSALVLMSLSPATSVGNVYLASNVLTNNSVQMVIEDVTVFDLDNANTIAALDNATLKQVVGANALDKAYWIVTEDGSLKVLDGSSIGSMMGLDNAYVVFGDNDSAYSFADLEAGDRVITGVSSYTYHLVAGWNLIGVPFNVPNSAIESFFPADVRASMVNIWAWNETAQNWVFYSPDPNAYFYGYYPALTKLDTGRAYWVEMTAAKDVMVEGTIPDSAPASPVAIVPAWNFLGITGVTPQSPATMYPGTINVWAWNASAQNWVFYSPDPNAYFYGYYPALTALNPGDGHWVEMPAEV